MLEMSDEGFGKEKNRKQEKGSQNGRSGGGKWQIAILNRSGSMKR